MPYDSKGNFMTWDQLDKAISTANANNAAAGKPSWEVKTTTPVTTTPVVSSGGSSGNNGKSSNIVPPTTQGKVAATSNPVANQFQYLTNMANGKDEYGNPVTAGQSTWAADQLKNFTNTPTTPTPSSGNVSPAPSSNSLLPSTGGVGGMIDKVAPVFVLLILFKIIGGIFGRR